MLTSKHHIWKERKTYKRLDKNEHTLFLILRRTFFKALSSTYPNLKQKIYFYKCKNKAQFCYWKESDDHDDNNKNDQHDIA